METTNATSGLENSTPTKVNRINLNSIRLDQHFAAGKTIKQTLEIPIIKPGRHKWFMVHPDYELHTKVLNLKDDREIYLVDEPLWDEFGDELTPSVIVPYLTRQGNLHLWVRSLPEKDNSWTRSANKAAELAKTGWIRIVANMEVGAYDVFQPRAQIAPPVWPDKTMNDMVDIAFEHFFIENPKHPRLLALLGAE